jgi:AP2 domain
MTNDNPNRNNQLGVRGVCIHRGRFRAEIMTRGKQKHIGYFDSIESAASAYAAAVDEPRK